MADNFCVAGTFNVTSHISIRNTLKHISKMKHRRNAPFDVRSIRFYFLVG